MAHTKEENWYKRRQELRASVYDYYKARGILIQLKRELGIRNQNKLDPWSYKAPSLRELAQFVKRLEVSVKGDKISFGLHKDSAVKSLTASSWCVVARRCRVRVEPIDEQIQSVEETYELLLSAAKDPHIQVATMPRYFEHLVLKKDIAFPTGKVTFEKAREWGQKDCTHLMVLNARELRGKWLEEAGIRAFRVVVLPGEDAFAKSASAYKPVTGYVVRSSITNSVTPAFHIDLIKAVSLCKRRVKAAVMKQMGL